MLEDEDSQLQVERDVKAVNVQCNRMHSFSGNDDGEPIPTACQKQLNGPLVRGVDVKLEFEVQRDYET